MSDSNTQVRSGGIGFAGLLTILFIGLKLTNNIDWSWWWVLSPLWLPIALILGIVAVILVFAAAAWGLAAFCELLLAKKSKPRSRYRGL